MHYYEFNIGDYMRDTAHLDEMEDLAYRRMLDLYYLKESPLPKSVAEIAKLIRMRTHSESIANVLREYFTLTDDGYVNAKANSTLLKIYDKSEKAKKSAEKRWENQRLKNANALPTDSERNANGMLPNNLIPNNLEPNNIGHSDESPKQDFLAWLFEKFWKNYNCEKTSKVKKQDAKKAFMRLMRGKSDKKAEMLTYAMLTHYQDNLVGVVFGANRMHPTTYINKRQWEDEPEFMEKFEQQWEKDNEQPV